MGISTQEQRCGDVTLQSSTGVACGGRGRSQALQPACPSWKPQAQAGQHAGMLQGERGWGRHRVLLRPLLHGCQQALPIPAGRRCGGLCCGVLLTCTALWSWATAMAPPCSPCTGSPRAHPSLAPQSEPGPPGSPRPGEWRRRRCLWGQGRQGSGRSASPAITAARPAATRVGRCICLKKNCL